MKFHSFANLPVLCAVVAIFCGRDSLGGEDKARMPYLGDPPLALEEPAGSSIHQSIDCHGEVIQGQQPTSGFSIDRFDRLSVVAAYHRLYLDSEGFWATHDWNGNVTNCEPGTVSATLQDDTLRRLNYYRAQAGLPGDIGFDSTLNAKCQKAALIFARQNSISHYPCTDWPTNACLSTEGCEAAGKSNIAYGNYGPDAIDAFMFDTGSNNSAVGHRRWFLYSRAKTFGHGSIPSGWGFDAVWVIGNNKPAPPAQAVPWPNAGYVPHPIVPNDASSPARWSFTYPGANFSNATITMTRGGQAISLTKEAVANGYGDNTVVWKPVGLPSTPPSADTTYTVTVSGLTGAPQSTYTYDVIVIDPYDLGIPMVISGPQTPLAGTQATYTFPAVQGADSYSFRVSQYAATDWLEGAEDVAPQVVDNTSSEYNLISTATKASGAKSFHLTAPYSFAPLQSFEIDRLLIANSLSKLSFKQLFRCVTSVSRLSAQLSKDDGASWTTIWSRQGNDTGSCGSAHWDPSFQSEEIDVPTEFEDRTIRLRFLFDAGSSAYFSTSDNVGVYLDDISLSNSLSQQASTTYDLASPSHTLTVGASGESITLQAGATLAGHFFGYGNPLVVTPQTLPPAPVITSPTELLLREGQPVNYTIVATNTPTSYAVSNLPAGLTFDSQTGTISGLLAPGVYSGIVLQAGNLGGTGSLQLTIIVQTGYEAWKNEYFPGLGAPSEDDDGDGFSNLLEAAILGLDPTSGQSQLPPVQTVNQLVTWSIPKSGVVGLHYEITCSSEPDRGYTDEGLTILAEDSTVLTIGCTVTAGQPVFLRLRVWTLE